MTSNKYDAVCSYCLSGWHPTEMRPGNCRQCGAPQLKAMEFIEEEIEYFDPSQGGVSPHPYFVDVSANLITFTATAGEKVTVTSPKLGYESWL